MALHRLQLEIVQRNHNKGIFAWQGEQSAHSSMFAASPHCFPPADIRPLPFFKTNSVVDCTHTVTNYGVRMPLSLYKADVVTYGSEDIKTARSDQLTSCTSYTLKVTALGTISVVSGDSLSDYDGLVMAILADGKPGKSLALLLGYHASDD